MPVGVDGIEKNIYVGICRLLHLYVQKITIINDLFQKKKKIITVIKKNTF